jgi:hypothetical protein
MMRAGILKFFCCRCGICGQFASIHLL